MRQARQHIGDRRLRDGGGALSIDGGDDLDVRILLQHRYLRRIHRHVRRRALHATDDNDIALVMDHLHHRIGLRRLVAGEVEVELRVARRRGDRIEGDHLDAGPAGLLDDAVLGGLGRGIDGDGIDAFQDKFGELAVLLADAAVAIQNNIVADLALGLRLLGGGSKASTI